MRIGTLVRYGESFGVVTSSIDGGVTLALHTGETTKPVDVPDSNIILSAEDILQQFEEAVCKQAQ